MSGEDVTVTPADQWWAIQGSELLEALHRAHQGDEPEVVYLELFANSETDNGTETGA